MSVQETWKEGGFSFSHNEITYVPVGVIAGASGSLDQGMNFLYLNDNKISAIHPDAFPVTLGYLCLQNNYLTYLP